MGGVVGVVVRTPDGKQYPMTWGTNALRNIKMRGWLTLDPSFWNWAETFSRWEGENHSTLAPKEYGLVVVDHISKQIISRQTFTSFEELAGERIDLSPFVLDQQIDISAQQWEALIGKLEELGFVLNQDDRTDWSRWISFQQNTLVNSQEGLDLTVKDAMHEHLKTIYGADDSRAAKKVTAGCNIAFPLKGRKAETFEETLQTRSVALSKFVELIGFDPEKVVAELSIDAANLTSKYLALNGIRVERDFSKTALSEAGIAASNQWLDTLVQRRPCDIS